MLKPIIKVNLWLLLIIIGILLGAYSRDVSPQTLFYPPTTPFHPLAAFFTHAFQLSCYVAPVICLFTFALATKLEPGEKTNVYFLLSGITTGLFLLNEIYRIHIILLMFRVPKLYSIASFALILFSYLWVCWRWIKTTPYFNLALSLFLLLVAISIDSLHLTNFQTASLLEGIPKLLSGFNLAWYFWRVCQERIFKLFDKVTEASKSVPR